jgi:1-acylglycerol-3-phosphate O-acyltransferase
MEKYSQFRDRGSGVSPFIPHTTPVSFMSMILHSMLFLFRLPFFISYALVYFCVLTHLPLPAVMRKLLLWGMLGIPGVWWVDLQLDGVKRGSLAQQDADRIPYGGSVIASQFTSPLDALYLAAIFDPIFIISYPGTRRVRRVSLLSAIMAALAPVTLEPPQGSGLTDLRALVDKYPQRAIVVFPEAGTTNGKGILPFSPSLLSTPADTRIFPVSLRYTPQDITTPVPGAYLAFLWNLLSRPTHCIRVRIAEAVLNTSEARTNGFHDDSEAADAVEERLEGEEPVTSAGQRVLDKVGEALARLGRNKRVGLTLRDKARFVEAWKKGKK